MPEMRLVMHHFDPMRPGLGGIDTCIRGLVRFGTNQNFDFIGSARQRVQADERGWHSIEMEGSQAQLLYVAHLRGSGGVLPNSLALVAGAVQRRRAVREATPDVVQVHRPEVVPLARRLFPSARLDLFLHEDASRWKRTTSESRWRHFKPLYLRLLDSSVRVADRVVSFSPTASERLSDSNVNLVVVPTWFDPETFVESPCRRGQGRRLLWIGRLEAVKDPALALEVIRRLPDEDTVTLVGDGRLRAEIQRAVRDMGLGQRVKLRGMVAKAEVAELMREHDVLLMTSHSEGFPRVMVEALASGRPVVATGESDTGRLLTSGVNGGRAASRDPGELVQLVELADGVEPATCRATVAHLSATEVVPVALGASRG